MTVTAKDLSFIDLFAGIGGFHRAFVAQGAECVFACEWDKFAQKSYVTNYGINPVGDIKKLDNNHIPYHDILCAGIPCPAFSVAGVSSRNHYGYKTGLTDTENGGDLFFDVARILDAKRPAMFLLENVKNLYHHKKGETFKTIITILEDLGYHIYHKIVDAQDYVPQRRQRIYIVGFIENVPFQFPESPQKRLYELVDMLEENPDDKYTLGDHAWQYAQDYKAKHRAAGHGFGYNLVVPGVDLVTPTLPARYYKDGINILIDQSAKGKNPRKITPREAARLMGYPEEYQIAVSDSQAYKQFGNSVVVPVVTAIAGAMTEAYLNRPRLADMAETELMIDAQPVL